MKISAKKLDYHSSEAIIKNSPYSMFRLDPLPKFFTGYKYFSGEIPGYSEQTHCFSLLFLHLQSAERF